MLLGLYSILSGFILARAMERNKQLKLEFLDFLSEARTFAATFRATRNSVLDLLYAAINDTFSRGEQVPATHARLQQLEDAVERHPELAANAQKTVVRERCASLRKTWSSLEFLKSNGVSHYEHFVLLLLGAMMVYLAYSVSDRTPWFTWLRLGLVSGLVLVLFAIRDFDACRPTETAAFLARAQLSTTPDLTIKPYIPHDLLLISDASAVQGSTTAQF